MNKERTTTTTTSNGQLGDTIRIRRPPRVFTTDLGKNVWMGDVDPCELELELENGVNTDPYDSGATDEPHATVWRRSATGVSYPGPTASAGERWRHR